MTFEDHFSGHARVYAQFRPEYPAAWYAALAALAPGRALAWDCGTGNGQAAAGLAAHFAHVYATDASAEQIALARPAPGVSYAVAPAEQCALADGTVDLVTVAQAVHWFDHARFYAEVRRVLRSGGVLAVWVYHLIEVDPAVDALIVHYHNEIVGPYCAGARAAGAHALRGLAVPVRRVAGAAAADRTRLDARRIARAPGQLVGGAALPRGAGR